MKSATWLELHVDFTAACLLFEIMLTYTATLPVR